MGKKIKKKGRSAHKEKRSSSGPNRSASEYSNPCADSAVAEDLSVKDGKLCNHIDKSFDFDKVAWKIGSTLKCEDCRDNSGNGRRPGKGKIKQNRKREIRPDDSNPKSLWICLQCGHVACGGPAGDKVPRSHALQHMRRTRHPCVIQFDSSLLCWCFSCNSLAPVQSDGFNEETDDSLLKVRNLIKDELEKFGQVDVEDDYVASNLDDKKLGDVESSSISDIRVYKVKGLINLGNTCFFNSIMQNILSMKILRNYFLNMNSSFGPLTMALKKLFYETSPEVDSKGCLNPKNFFGCICSRAPQFRGYQQQDSHELLRYLLDGLYIEELNARKLTSSHDEEVSSKLGPTFVDLVFGGQISSTVCCMECGHTSIVYEPFLDLSLPLPTKKPPSKKAPISRSKRAKFPIKEGNKGRKFEERKKNDVVASLSSEVESDSVRIPVEPPALSMTVDAAGTHSDNVVSVADPYDFSWMDYCGDDISPGINPVFQCSDAVVTQVCDEGQTSMSENTLESSVDVSSLNNKSEVKPELNAEKSIGLDVPTHIQDSEGLLLSHKEEKDDKGMGVTGGEESNKNLVNCSEEIEDFDGFGDLFNEPEATSQSTAGSKSFEEVEMALLAGNSSESNPDEVDDTNSEVTIDSCLAFFTKPELLSDEHAWYCECCSKISKGQKKRTRERIQQNGNENVHAMSLKSQPNMPGNRDDNLPCKYDKDLSHSARRQCLDNGNVVCNLQKFEGKDENSVTCDLGEGRNDRVLDSKSLANGLGDHHEASRSDDDVVGSSHFNKIHETSLLLSESSNAHSTNLTDQESSAEVHQTWKEDFQLCDRGEESDGSVGEEVDSESMKVKRDASKRILISKAPHILTIHLKRFGQDACGRLSKISGHVSFRETLNLRPYMDPRFKEDEKCWYHLVGVVEHLGTMRGGHYVAYVRGERNKRQNENDVVSSVWFYASDASVSEVSLTEVLQSEAYILFYEKV